MGEVYRARDTALQRDVALKILPTAVEQDPDRLARFTREAQALAALNHPHIAQVYGLQQLEGAGRHAIVMELVDGPTLADRMAQGPLPVSEVIAIARQIAEALDAAHERGIVHRDLKPANIKLTGDGLVKVLDFGLARTSASGAWGATGAVRDAAGGMPAAGAADPTMLSPAVTQRGVILGTAAYMAPEQARGQAIDKRADIWAFGVVLYELLTGRTLFAGATMSDTIANVLKREVDLSALPAATPSFLRRVIARCLEHDPRKRLRDIADAAYELAAPDTPPAASSRPTRLTAPAAVVLMVLVAAAGAAGLTWWMTRPVVTPAVVARAAYELPGGAVRRTIQRQQLAISPDGRYIATIRGSAATSSAAMIRRIDQLEWTMAPGSENAGGVFFSPDSQWLGFWNSREIHRVSVSGGAPQKVYTLESAQLNGPEAVSWADTGLIYLVEEWSRVVAVPATGGAATRIIDGKPGGVTSIGDVHALAGNQGLLYTRTSAATSTSTIVLHRPESSPDVDVVDGGTPRALADGRLLFARGSSLFVAPFDVAAGRLTAEPVMVVQGVAMLSPVTQYAVSSNGTLVYIPGEVASEAIASFYRVSREGVAVEMPAVAREYSDPRLSPDGRRLAVHLSDEQNDVWITDLARGAIARMSFTPLEDETPAWSPDGQWIAYAGWCGTGEENRCVYQRRSDGSGEPDVLWKADTHVHVTDWSPDGRTLVLESIHVERRGDILLLDVGGSKPRDYLTTAFAEQAGRVSPDGRWLAYQSFESGRSEIYLQSFPAPGNKMPVSTDGGIQPVWARDGRELYFRSPTHVMAARIGAAGALTVDRPVALFRDTYLRPQGDNHTGYDVFADGRFLFIDLPRGGTTTAAPPALVAVFNWFEELKSADRK
jgi:serine/threonine-protein kinase